MTDNPQLDEAIDRAVSVKPGESKQPRFSQDARSVFLSMIHWVDKWNLKEPPLSPDTRARDIWLSEIWQAEPHMSGVVSSYVSLKKNQGWSLTGGSRQVRSFDEKLHRSEGGKGWRVYSGKQATSYVTTDLGALTEISYMVRIADSFNPMIDQLPEFANLYHLDPTRCYLSGDPLNPLYYYPSWDIRGSGLQKWKPWDFFRAASMQSIREDYRDVGYCALSRALELTKIMIGVIQHDLEELSANAPTGFLTLSGISKPEWEMALNENREDAANEGRVYSNDLMVLASNNTTVEAKLVSLSNLPKGFTLDQWLAILMQGYALCFGMDVGEFYTLQGGNFGQSGQAKVQDEKATAKGERDFSLEMQENIQDLLPKTVQFNVDERDDTADQNLAETHKTIVETAVELYSTGLQEGAPMLNHEQIQRYLVKRGVLDEDDLISTADSQATATDTEQARSSIIIRRAAEKYPDEPIIRRHHDGREVVLFTSGAALLQRMSFPAAKLMERAKLYDKGDVTITDQDVDEALAIAEDVDPMLGELMSAKKVEV